MTDSTVKNQHAANFSGPPIERSIERLEVSTARSRFGISCALLLYGLQIWLDSPAPQDGSPFLSVTPKACKIRVPTSTEAPFGFPHLRPRSKRCEVIFIANVVLTTLYWMVVVSLFARGRWRERYYRAVFWIVVSASILASFLVRDVAVLIILVIPMILNICIVGCSFADVYQADIY